MEPASAIGITSFGLTVCRGLLSYYDSWRGYTTDITTTYACIADLSRTLTAIQDSLESPTLDQLRATRVKTCLDSCVDGLHELKKKLQKLQTHPEPSGLRQKAWTELQRSFYPFRDKTLKKLKDTVSDLQDRLALALQVLKLDIGIASSKTLHSIEATTQATANDVRTLIAEQRAALPQHIINWLLPPDPWTNHSSARRLWKPHTGEWLLQSDTYQRWRSGHIRNLWLRGKAGCGKTVLLSTVIEDLLQHCKAAANSRLLVFYFTFSDNRKQTFEDLLRSLVAQLGAEEPAKTKLMQACKQNNDAPELEALEEILVSTIGRFDEVFVALDALDECPVTEDARRKVLDFLEGLSQKSIKLKIFATSRDVGEIKEYMSSLAAETVDTNIQAVDDDIQRYVASELLQDKRLLRLNDNTKTLIKETIAQKADGMFRCAYCQLQELKKLRALKPKYIQHALRNLPPTLDATYSRMLDSIDDIYHQEALALLRWIAYAKSPLTLRELAEAAIIDPDGDGYVDTANRGPLEDTLEILSGLIVLTGPHGEGYTTENDEDDDDDHISEDESNKRDGSGTNSNNSNSESSRDSSQVGRSAALSRSVQSSTENPRIRLAHFSVQEYLESSRMLKSKACTFHLIPAHGHRFLAQSCLTYMMYYSHSGEKTGFKEDQDVFPLLQYAARSWFYHSRLQEPLGGGYEANFLDSDAFRNDWITAAPNVDYMWQIPFDSSVAKAPASGLYYASLFGLVAVADEILARGADVNTQGGRLSNALNAGSASGHANVVELLLAAGANVNRGGENYLNALQAASCSGKAEGVKLLLKASAGINVRGKDDVSALQVASSYGHVEIVEILLKFGADINARGGRDNVSALQTASFYGHVEIVKILLKFGADINARGGSDGSALQAASRSGRVEIVKILLKFGADVESQEGFSGSALQAASRSGHIEIVQILLHAGADVNTQGGSYNNALHAASFFGYVGIVEELLRAGADVNVQGGPFGDALRAASIQQHNDTVEILLHAGADVNAQTSENFSSALQTASYFGRIETMKTLLNAGADINARGGPWRNALHAASRSKHNRQAAMELLIQHGAVDNDDDVTMDEE